MTLEVAPRIHMINSCFDREGDRTTFSRGTPDWFTPEKLIHSTTRSYLIDGEMTLLYDNLPPVREDALISELHSLLGEKELDYIVVSHCEPPHAGNTVAVKNEYEDSTIIAPRHINHRDMHEFYYLNDAMLVEQGDTLDLGGGYSVEFKDGMLMDGPTVWAFEEKTRTLFTSDAFGAYHQEGDCQKFHDELDVPDTKNRFIHFHEIPMFWFHYTDPMKIKPVFEEIESMDPAILAPAHGLPVRKNIPEVLSVLEGVIELFSNENPITTEASQRANLDP